MKKFFTSMILMAMFAINVMAQDLTYEFTSYVGTEYQGFTATVDAAAVQAVLGCTLAEASAFAVQSDGTEDSNYQLGETDGWRDAEGNWSTWGETATHLCVKADFTLETEQIYYIGGMQNTAAETYTATYKLYNPDDNTKSMKIFVKLNYVEAPIYKLADLTIAGQAEATFNEYPRSSYKTTWYGIEAKDLTTALGMTAEELASGVSGLAFCKEFSADGSGAWDGNIKQHSSFAFAQLFDENTGRDLEECAYSETDTKFWIDNVAFDSDSLWIELGQEANACSENDQYFGYLYIVNGSKAYQFKVTLKIDPKPESGGFASMTKVGSQTISLKRDINSGYTTTAVDLEAEAIAAALGVDLSSATFMAFASEAKDELTDSYTTSESGFWMDMHSMVVTWADAVAASTKSYFVNPVLADGQVEIGHMPNVFDGGEKTDGSLFLVFGEKYYELVMDVQIGDEPDPEAKTPEECETVATVAYEYEIIPGSSYQDDYMASDAGMIDLGIDWITETLGGTPTFYGMKENTTTSSLEYSIAYSCDPYPGFWMIPATGEYQFNTSTVGTWDSSCSYGVCYADGVLQFFQFPDVRSIGDTYDSDFYLVNISEGKKIKVHLTVSYVETRTAQKTVVGSSDYSVEASEDGEETAVENLADIYAALGCEAEEFEATGEVTGALTATKFVSQENGYYDDTYRGFPCDANGYIVDPNTKADDVVFYLGFEEGNFIVTVMDEAVLESKLTGHLGFEFGENRYVCNVSFGKDSTGINAISLTNQATGKTFNLAGQAVDGTFKGIVIRNGQKQLVK